MTMNKSISLRFTPQEYQYLSNLAVQNDMSLLAFLFGYKQLLGFQHSGE